MSKKLAIGLLLMLATDYDVLAQPAKSWVELDKNKVISVIIESLKKADPRYADDKQPSQESTRELNHLKEQLVSFEQAATRKCIDQFVPKGETPIYPLPTFSLSNLAPNGTMAKSIRDLILSEKKFQQRLQANPDYNNCISKIRQNPLFNDTKSKPGLIDAFDQTQNHQQFELQKQAENLLNLAITRYAEQHGYQLIIAKSWNSVLYNQRKVTLDVTEDVLDFIKKNPPVTAQEPGNK